MKQKKDFWYCFQGSNVQPSDKDFIESLLNIYTTYTIPIIFVHTQTYSKKQSKTCKMGIEKYLNEIYNNDENKVNELLKNYIDILARPELSYTGGHLKKSFGLDKLETITVEEIENKGFKSSYLHSIKENIYPIFKNGSFNEYNK